MLQESLGEDFGEILVSFGDPRAHLFSNIFETFLEHVFEEAPEPLFKRILHRFLINCLILFSSILVTSAKAKNLNFGCYLLYFMHVGYEIKCVFSHAFGMFFAIPFPNPI